MAKASATPIRYSNEQIVNAATGRWGEIAQGVKPAEPYVINVPDSDETITIPPLTRRRRKGLKAAQAAYLMMGAQLAKAEEDQDTDQGTLTRIEGVLAEAEKSYEVAVFGGEEIRDRVVELFDELDEAYWDAMWADIHDVLINRTADLPKDTDEDGVTETGEGKGRSSST